MGFTDGIWRAVGYFLAALWIWSMYRAGQLLHKEYRSKVRITAVILGIVGMFTYISWRTLGTHVEGDDEPLLDDGNLIRDYKPTNAQRNRAATTVFLLTFLPLAAGGLAKDDPAASSESRNR
jgi:hypothetical protein